MCQGSSRAAHSPGDASLSLGPQGDAASQNPYADDPLQATYLHAANNCPNNFVLLPGKKTSSIGLGRLCYCASDCDLKHTRGAV